MGFISATTSVTVEAKLTDAGKRKLYESIENNSSGFITKFAVGDSDANYAAIAAGTNTLGVGHVPEASGFKPGLRSFALYKGQYRPGIPVLLINGEYGSDNGVTRQLSIGSNERVLITFDPTTEWPKDEAFSEAYRVFVQNPGNLTEAALHRLFTAAGPTPAGQYAFQFNGGASDQELEILIGLAGGGNLTSVPIKLVGAITNAQIMFNIQLIQ